METQEKYKYVNQGYSLALFLPDEFKAAVKNKMLELGKTGKNKEKWQAMSKGYEMATLEKTKERKQELAKIKAKKKGKLQGRTR